METFPTLRLVGSLICEGLQGFFEISFAAKCVKSKF